MNDRVGAMSAEDFATDRRVEVMCRELFGNDQEHLKAVIAQAMLLCEDYQADYPTDAMAAIQSSFFGFMLLTAAVPDLTGAKLQDFMLDHYKLIRPVAQWMAEQQRELMFNPQKAGGDG